MNRRSTLSTCARGATPPELELLEPELELLELVAPELDPLEPDPDAAPESPFMGGVPLAFPPHAASTDTNNANKEGAIRKFMLCPR
jgi:hypothetical protein